MDTNLSTIDKKAEIIKFIRNETRKGRYPTYDYIDNKFKTNIRTHFKGGIRGVYKDAGVEYIRDPNPFLKYRKEEMLTKICIQLFKRMGYEIIRVSIFSDRHGPDIILKDKQGRQIPVEIKAYQKYGRIGESGYSNFFLSVISQLEGYIKSYNSPFGILITSTDRVKISRKKIKVFAGRELKQMLIEYDLSYNLKILEKIRNEHVSCDKDSNYSQTKDEMIRFIKSRLDSGIYTSRRDIEKTFGCCLSTYFDSLSKIYSDLNFDKTKLPRARMGGNVDKEDMRARMLDFIKTEMKSGRNPTYKEIQREFGCLPTLFFPCGIREMHSCLGLEYNRKFAVKTPEEREKIKSKIIEFIRECHENGQTATYRNIQERFNIGVSNYFSGVREAYQTAGIEIGSRKGLRIV